MIDHGPASADRPLAATMPPSEVRRFFVILNPNASRGGAAGTKPEIEAAFRTAGVECRLVATEARGHAVALAERAALEGWSAVVAVGGDGVVHEVANGLVRAAGDRPTVPLAIVPVGSGNDFVKLLGVPPHRPAAAVRRMVEAVPRQVDIGRVRHHVMGAGPPDTWYFTNGVGVGFDAQVARHASRVQRLRGFSIYAWAVVKTLSNLQSPRIRVVLDGREITDRPLLLTTISNGACHGGNFWLCPGARVDDGELDVLIADRRTLPAVLGLLPRVLFGKHLGQKGVELRRGQQVTVESAERLPIHADGEIVAEWVQKMEIDVLPGRLTVLA